MKLIDLLINMQAKAFNKALKTTTDELDTLDSRINNLEHNPEETKNKQDKNDVISFVLFGLLALVICNYGLYALNDIDISKVRTMLSPEKQMQFYQWFFFNVFLMKILGPMLVIGFGLRSLFIQIDNLPFRKEKALSEYKARTMEVLISYRERLVNRQAELIEAIRKIKTS